MKPEQAVPLVVRVWTALVPSTAILLLLSLSFHSSAVAQVKTGTSDARQEDRLIEAMVSHNKEPKIVLTVLNNEVPLFAHNYDWPEQDRVWNAMQNVIKTKSDAMWWRLVQHINDARYALTGDNNDFVDMTARNFSVGELCSHIASEDLGAPYLRHLRAEEWRIFPTFHPQDEFWKHKGKWAGKPLYLIQIAVCRRAIEEMALAKGISSAYGGESPAHTFTAAEKATFTEDVKKEIETLERTKQAITSTKIRLPGFDNSKFTAERGKEARELYKYGKRNEKDGK